MSGPCVNFGCTMYILYLFTFYMMNEGKTLFGNYRNSPLHFSQTKSHLCLKMGVQTKEKSSLILYDIDQSDH